MVEILCGCCSVVSVCDEREDWVGDECLFYWRECIDRFFGVVARVYSLSFCLQLPK